MGKSAAIVGQASTAALAPYQDRSWDIWGFAWCTPDYPRVDLLFDIHHPQFKSDHKFEKHYNSQHFYPEYPRWVSRQGIPVICDTDAVASFAPVGQAYPLAEVRALFPDRDVLECTVSYMVAYAILKGYRRIGFWGCHFVGSAEYLYQLPSVTYLMGYAEARGIEVVVAPAGPLMVSGYNAGRYGVNRDVRPRFQLP